MQLKRISRIVIIKGHAGMIIEVPLNVLALTLSSVVLAETLKLLLTPPIMQLSRNSSVCLLFRMPEKFTSSAKATRMIYNRNSTPPGTSGCSKRRVTVNNASSGGREMISVSFTGGGFGGVPGTAERERERACIVQIR